MISCLPQIFVLETTGLTVLSRNSNEKDDQVTKLKTVKVNEYWELDIQKHILDSKWWVDGWLLSLCV